MPEKTNTEGYPLAIEAAAAERMLFPKLWRGEAWTKIASNEPYQVGAEDWEGAARRTKAKTDFIAGESDDPDIDFPQLDEIEIGSALVRFDDMLRRLKVRPEEQPILFEQITRKHAELSRHRSIIESSRTQSEEERQRYLRYAEQLSVDLFGDVEPSVFNGAIEALKTTAKGFVNQYAKDLIDLLPDTEEAIKAPERYLLSPETIAKLGPIFEDFFQPSLDLVDKLPEGELDHEQSVIALQSMINAMGIEGAEVTLTTGGGLQQVVETNEFGQLVPGIHLGSNRAKLTKDSIKSAGNHEITHALNMWNGLNSKNDALAVGLPNSLAFEEGKCVVVEQVLAGKPNKERGMQYYTALGLRRGTLDGQKRSFRETYEVMWRRELVNSGKFDESDIEKAKNTAYNLVMRVSRGLAVDTRDLAYFNGNAKASEWFNHIATLPVEKAAELTRLTLITKADPTNPAHLEYLKENSEDWRKALEGVEI